MARVVLTDAAIGAEALRPLRGHDIVTAADGGHMGPDELADRLPGADALVCFLTDRVDAALLDRAGPSLRVVGTVAAGLNNIDLAAAHARGVVVCHTPDGPVRSTAELTMLLILAAARRLSEGEYEVRSGTWAGWSFTGAWGRDLRGLTLGLLGYGRIARLVAPLATAFGLDVRHHTRRDTGTPGYVATLDELLAVSDVLSVHIPYTPAVHHVIDAAALARLPRGAIVVNTARGGLVDEPALLAAVQSGHIFAAGLDVFEGEPAVWAPLLAERRIVVAPHIGSATREARLGMVADVATDVAAVLRGAAPRFAWSPSTSDG